jgi:ribonucleoside-triphosphate reductase (thioredoxin)
VISFPVKVGPDAVTRYDVTAASFLAMVHSTQKNWVQPGTERGQGTHNVSNTVNVRDGEWSGVADYLWVNRHELTGVSFIPEMGDQIYDYAPFEAVVTPEQSLVWHALVASYQPVDYAAIRETEDNTSQKAEAACAGGQCEWSPS